MNISLERAAQLCCFVNEHFTAHWADKDSDDLKTCGDQFGWKSLIYKVYVMHTADGRVSLLPEALFFHVRVPFRYVEYRTY